jgi:hypothetical protein
MEHINANYSIPEEVKASNKIKKRKLDPVVNVDTSVSHVDQDITLVDHDITHVDQDITHVDLDITLNVDQDDDPKNTDDEELDFEFNEDDDIIELPE